jgi:tellurite resistance-related uncharacterized protein
MKPFNLQKALAGEPVVTRDGNKVTEIHNFSTRHGEMTVFAIIEGCFLTFNNNGKHYSSEFVDSNFDLFMAEPEAWINIYYSKVQEKIWNSVKYNSEEEAKENIVTTNSSYLTTVQIS